MLHRRWCCLSVVIGAIGLVPCGRVFAAAAEAVSPPSTALLAVCRPGGAMLPATSTRAAHARRVAQVTRNDRADLTFELRPAPDGAVAVGAGGGELTIRKTVLPGGSWTLELLARNDRVTVSVAEHAVNVSRDKKSITVSLGSTGDDRLLAVRRLLADSRAVALFRGASAAIEASEDDAPASASVLMADALVGFLTGDVGAPRRIARHLARHALSREQRIGMATDCYAVWEQRVMAAWTEYTSCIMDVNPWAMLQIMCAARWSLMVEAYWWAFIACSSIPF